MRVLLTGGSGFIGRHIREQLRLHHEVLAPTHVELDLADAAAVRRWMDDHSVEAVVHTAVKPAHRNAPDQTDLAGDNLRQFFSLVRCRESFGRFVVLTSGAVYGAQRPLVSITEDQLDEDVPTDDHGFSKYVEAVWLSGDADAVELRPFGVYGPGEDYAIRFISNAICKALLGLPVTLRRDRLFSYVWVEDLAVLVERALETRDGGLPPGAYNVTTGDPIGLRALADLVISTSGADVPVIVGDPTPGPEYSGDGSKLASVDPSYAFTGPVQGIERLLEWYAARRDRIDRSVLETDR